MPGARRAARRPLAAARLPPLGAGSRRTRLLRRRQGGGLTRTEFNILELLMGRPQKVFTKQELFELAWGEPYSVEDSTVNVHVSNLRRKLKPTGTDGYLQNRVGHGLQTAQRLTDDGPKGYSRPSHAAHLLLTISLLSQLGRKPLKIRDGLALSPKLTR